LQLRGCVEPHDPHLRADRVREPRGRVVAGIVAAHVGAPHRDGTRGRKRVERDRIAAVGREDQAAAVDRRADEREARGFALGDEDAVGVDGHPLAIGDAVAGEAGRAHLRGVERDAGGTLERVERQRADDRLHRARGGPRRG
jgi:hypothetical protein